MTRAQLKLALVMSPFSLLSQLIGNHLSPTELVVTPKLVAIALTPITGNALCPPCGQSSDRIHSRYRRILADLPLCGRRLILILRLRKFLCTTAGCPRRIFCERIPGLAAPTHDPPPGSLGTTAPWDLHSVANPLHAWPRRCPPLPAATRSSDG